MTIHPLTPLEVARDLVNECAGTTVCYPLATPNGCKRNFNCALVLNKKNKTSLTEMLFKYKVESKVYYNINAELKISIYCYIDLLGKL